MVANPYTMPEPQLWIQKLGGDTPATSYDGTDLRQLMRTMWFRAGRLRPTNFRVTTAPAWGVTIASGKAVVALSDNTRALVRLDTATVLDLTGFNTAPVATRTHKIYLAVYDKSITGTLYEARLVATEDTGAGAPTPADSPAGSLHLATFTISPSQTFVADSHITNIAGLADYSDPVTISLAAGYASAATESGSVAPQYWSVYGEIKLKGAVKPSSGDFGDDDSYLIATLPKEIWPVATRYGCITGQADASTSITLRIKVEPDGKVTINTPAGWAPSWISLDGFSYQINE